MTKFKELLELTVFLAYLYDYTAKALGDKKIFVSEDVAGAFYIGPELRPAFEGIAKIKKPSSMNQLSQSAINCAMTS